MSHSIRPSSQYEQSSESSVSENHRDGGTYICDISLPMKQLTDHKLLLFTFRSIRGLAASYITDVLSRHQPARTPCPWGTPLMIGAQS